MAKSKGAPKAPNLTPEQVATESKRQAAVKRASRKSARAAAAAAPKADPAPAQTGTPEPTPEAIEAKRMQAHDAYVAALRVDAKATLGEDASEEAIADYIKSQLAGTETQPKGKYHGPMLILRDAAKHYVKGIHCGDALASLLDGLTREQVVAVIGEFLVAQKVIEHRNPYLHLNPGQQSMNLRNKLRGALKAGTVKLADLAIRVQALKAATKEAK